MMKAKSMLCMTMSDDCVLGMMMVGDSMCFGWQDDDIDDDEDFVWDDNESEECVKDKNEIEDLLKKSTLPTINIQFIILQPTSDSLYTSI